MKPLHIFKPGRHQPMNGGSLDFTERDLIATAQAYDPALHEAPLVIGHPRHDAPAAGWVKSLSVTPSGLIAEPQQIDPAFAEQIAKSNFKKISASFYHPEAANNPVPGVYYLRHVGFLGAMPPSVKGLRPIELAEHEDGVIEFAEFSQPNTAQLWRKFREFLIARFGTETADSVAPSWEIDSLVEPSPSFAEPIPASTEHPPMSAQHQALLQENQRLQSAIKQRETADKAAEQSLLHASHSAFAEQLVKGGMKPIHCAAVIAALDFAEGAEAPIEFGEADDRKPLSQGLKAIFSELTGALSFTEQARKDRVEPTAINTANPLLADAESRSH